MKKLLCLLALLLITLYAFSQSSEYMVDNFDDNSYRWPLSEKDEYSNEIAGGKMIMLNRTMRYHWYTQNVPTEKKKDFRIETEFTFTKFTKSGYAGILWNGSDDANKICFFMVSPDGTYNYGTWAPEFFSITGSQKSAAINKGLGTNKVAVQKSGGKVKLFINDVEVHSAKFPSVYGKNVGLITGGGAFVVESDYFRVAAVEE